MQDQTCHLFAADSDAEAGDWISVINQALQPTFEEMIEEQKNGDLLCHLFLVNKRQNLNNCQ